MPKAPTFKINVSDLHMCRRCPRLLAWQLSGKTTAWHVGRKGKSFCGSIFHDNIAAPFHNDAAGQNGVKKRRSILEVFKSHPNDAHAMKKALFGCIYQNYFSPFLDEHSHTLSNEQIGLLGNIIEKWGDFLIDFFHRNSGFREVPEAFTDHAFLPPEKTMKASYIATNGTVLTVSGRFDSALLDHTRGEVLLVEYKCLKETDPTVELAQLALYAWLIREHTGLLPRSCVLYLEEENPLVHFSVIVTGEVISELPKLFDTAIQVMQAVKSGKETIPKTDNPTLCKQCPYNRDCDSRFGS